MLIDKPVPFEIEMIDADGFLSGTVSEPNTFRDDMGSTLTATIAGQRSGDQVSMRKTYNGFEQDDPIYEGRLNDACNRITGTFHFEILPMIQGRFVMVRAVSAKARQKVAVAAELDAIR